MEAGGYYAEHSAPQEAYGGLGLEWLADAARGVEPLAAPAPLVIADMGAAGGGNSLLPMQRAIDAYREQAAAAPVLVVHTDIPTNDFTALFELIESSPDSYLRSAGVFALAIGRSFFGRLFPDEYLSLGWSSIAVHWLSDVPEPIPEHIYCSFATGSAESALRAQSRRDWQLFLESRAAELRKSGRLVVVGGAARDDGSSGAEGLMTMANDALRRLTDAGELRDAEYRRMTIPTWNRTTAEFRAPLETGDAGAGLELRRHAFRTLSDPYFAAYQQDEDVDRYARAQADFFHAAFEPSLWAALDPERTQAGREQIAGHFGEELRSSIASDPAAAACEWHVVVLEIEKS